MKERASYYFSTATCGYCGKEFSPAPYHIYKENKKIFCSWNCLCAYRKKRTKKTVTRCAERNKEMANLYNEGMSIVEIAKRYSLAPNTARMAVERGLEILEGENKNV